MVSGLIVEGKRVVGVKTALGIEIKAKAVVLTNGTFLNGKYTLEKELRRRPNC